MLGDAQWAWLAERLREPAALRLIVSSIQVLAEGHGWERWSNLPKERQRLFDLIRDTGARSVPVPLRRPSHRRALSRDERHALSAHRAHIERTEPDLPGQSGTWAQPPRGGLWGSQFRLG